jgi:hypothetical protein
MNSPRRDVLLNSLLAIGLCLGLAVSVHSQVKTETSSTAGTSTTQVQVERGEVVWAQGNDLLVKMDDGSLRHITNVPESTRIMVDGKELSVHELKPGMKLQRTITTTTTPKTVTTVKTVTGTVWNVMPPNSVILRLEDGSTQRFSIPKGQKFMVNGQETDAFGLKKGMQISATKVVEEPETVVEHQRQLTGTMPPPPPAPPADQPLLIVMMARATPPQPAAQAPSEPAKELPKTGSLLPLIGLIGALVLAAGLGLRAVRLTR